MNFTAGINPVEPINTPAYWLAFCGQKLLVDVGSGTPVMPLSTSLSDFGLEPVRSQYLGSLDGRPVFSAELPGDALLPGGMRLISLQRLYSLDERLFRLAGHAIQIVNWDKTHLYCGRCGTPTRAKSDERAKQCPNCGFTSFPRISPAVIVAVVKDGELLLARGTRFQAVMYSTLAGFVEAGETLEECVQREIREEVGIEVKNIRYFGSQSWPFPDSLMIGFTAEYASGDIRLDETEIMDAGWFPAWDLPPIPEKISIARQLIDWYIDKYGDNKVENQ